MSLLHISRSVGRAGTLKVNEGGHWWQFSFITSAVNIRPEYQEVTSFGSPYAEYLAGQTRLSLEGLVTSYGVPSHPVDGEWQGLVEVLKENESIRPSQVLPFERALMAADPEDEAPILIYQDWLLENGIERRHKTLQEHLERMRRAREEKAALERESWEEEYDGYDE